MLLGFKITFSLRVLYYVYSSNINLGAKSSRFRFGPLNREPFKSRAAKERVISLKFLTDDLGAGSKQAFDPLIAIDE